MALAEVFGTEVSYASVVRPMAPDERAFVIDSWVRSYERLMRPHEPTWGLSRWAHVSRVAQWCMAHGAVRISSVAEHPDIVLGWCCFGKDRLDYLYVKAAVRRRGIASELLASVGVPRGARVTHRPIPALRTEMDARGWQFRPLTKGEMDGQA